MKRFAAAVVLCVASAIPAGAAPVFLGFDELAPATVLDTEYAALGVVFSNSAGPLIVASATPGAPFTAPNAVLPANYFVAGNYSQATFSAPTPFVSVVLGDFNADVDNIYLFAYDATNAVVGSASAVLPSTLFGGVQLSVAAPNIAYARFYGVGVDANSVYFDNFEYDNAAIPEPASMLLFGSGLAGLAARRRRSANR